MNINQPKLKYKDIKNQVENELCIKRAPTRGLITNSLEEQLPHLISKKHIKKPNY